MIGVSRSILLLRKSKHVYIGISDRSDSDSKLSIYMPSLQKEPICSKLFNKNKNLKLEFEKQVKSYKYHPGLISLSDSDIFYEYKNILIDNQFGVVPVIHDFLNLLEMSKLHGTIEKTIGGYDELMVEGVKNK